MDNDRGHLPLESLSFWILTAGTLLLGVGIVTDSWVTLSLVDISANTILEGQMGLWMACAETCYATVHEDALLMVIVLVSIACATVVCPVLSHWYKGKYFYIYGLIELLGGIILAAALIVYRSKSDEIAQNNLPQYITKSVTLSYSFYVISAAAGCDAVAGLMTFYSSHSSVHSHSNQHPFSSFSI